jgi:hypothetical protein
MIDPIKIPILLKALDFLFEEGHKILADRRERRERQTMESLAQKDSPSEPVRGVPPPEIQKKEEIKQELVTTKIDELLWQNHQMEVEHLVRLLETYSRNYHLASEQYAKWGSALVPPIIVHNRNEAENSVAETLNKLEAVLSKVYKKDIHLNQ